MDFKPRVTIFHCINAFDENQKIIDLNINFIKMPCSSMTKDVFLLRAFEAGADGVVVLVCPQDRCQYVEGSLRAQKRVGYVKKLLDEIGIDTRRLSIYNLNTNQAKNVIQEAVQAIAALGPQT